MDVWGLSGRCSGSSSPMRSRPSILQFHPDSNCTLRQASATRRGTKLRPYIPFLVGCGGLVVALSDVAVVAAEALWLIVLLVYSSQRRPLRFGEQQRVLSVVQALLVLCLLVKLDIAECGLHVLLHVSQHLSSMSWPGSLLYLCSCSCS